MTTAPVRRSLTVAAPQARAFDAFTARIGAWWPRNKSIGAEPFSSAVIEPREGGRWYEIGEKGAECDWGKVLVWEPPHRAVLAWQIGADWKYDPALVTEVEVAFTPDGDGRTRVELEHRNLERFGAKAAALRAAFDSPDGWSGVLAAFAEAA